MSSIEILRNRLIDNILTTKNEKLLQAVSQIFELTQTEELVSLSSDQIELLMMGEKDMLNGRIVSETELDELDNQW